MLGGDGEHSLEAHTLYQRDVQIAQQRPVLFVYKVLAQFAAELAAAGQKSRELAGRVRPISVFDSQAIVHATRVISFDFCSSSSNLLCRRVLCRRQSIGFHYFSRQ